MTTTILNRFRPVTVDFTVKQVAFRSALWVQPGFFSSSTVDPHEAFARKFSWAIENSECFQQFEFIDSTHRLLRAERYGGIGIGENGGGVRCGNLGEYQIKGVGQNPLVGPGRKKWHSYGGLNARDAIYETIYAHVLNHVLPLGAARVYGVILTTPDGAYLDYEFVRGWGALLVREICLRPGHFIRAAAYTPRRDVGIRIGRDAHRVRDINRALLKHVKSRQQFVVLLGKLLQNYANQFAFARLARLTHGGVCPSNLCMDGRWIDLTNTTFIGGGQNVGGRPPFYEEPLAVLPILKEFADTFAKYNELDLNIAPLVNYYTEQFDAYFRHYASWLFGFHGPLFTDQADAHPYQFLTRQIDLLIGSGAAIINEWPSSIRENDPVLRLQEELFQSLADPANATLRLANVCRGVKGFDAKRTIDAFRDVLDRAFKHPKNAIRNWSHFVTFCVIESLKRTLFAEFFYKERLLSAIHSILTRDASKARDFIDQSIGISRWVFSVANTGPSYVFKNTKSSICFDPESGMYTHVESSHPHGETFASPDALAQAISAGFGLSMQDYDCTDSVLRILRLANAASHSHR